MKALLAVLPFHEFFDRCLIRIGGGTMLPGLMPKLAGLFQEVRGNLIQKCLVVGIDSSLSANRDLVARAYVEFLGRLNWHGERAIRLQLRCENDYRQCSFLGPDSYPPSVYPTRWSNAIQPTCS